MRSPLYGPMQSLSGKIFNTVLAFTLAVVLIFSVVTTSVLYFSYEQEAEQDLTRQAQDAADYLNTAQSSDKVSLLKNRFTGSVRYTLIAKDGTVLYDSASESSQLENHADRPEVKAAGEKGQAVMMRYSSTLKTDTLYGAVELEDESIIRLAETRYSLLAFMSDMLLPLVIAFFVVLLLVFVLSRLLTRRIMKPIDALNFKDPLQNEIYAEMNPLLERIDEQQKLLKQQNKELAQATSMRRDFSSNVSHEMKTPLQVISGYAELMKNDMVKPDDRQKFAGLIYEEAQSMRSLIDDVLTLSRLDESAINDSDQIVDLYAVGKRATERLAGFAETNGVTLEFSGDSTLIRGSETMVEQMIYNLLENGIRYNKAKGKVRLKIQQTEEGSEIQVSDTGLGIPHNMKDKIFERFFRVDKSRSKETGGTGLGLAIVKHAVSYHGGGIEVESEEGKGTTFTLKFPKMLY